MRNPYSLPCLPISRLAVGPWTKSHLTNNIGEPLIFFDGVTILINHSFLFFVRLKTIYYCSSHFISWSFTFCTVNNLFILEK